MVFLTLVKLMSRGLRCLSLKRYFSTMKESRSERMRSQQAAPRVEKKEKLAEEGLYTVIFFQGVTALRRGETDNCIMCRGENRASFPSRELLSTPIPLVPAWRSVILLSTSSSSLTTFTSAGCSIWLI